VAVVDVGGEGGIVGTVVEDGWLAVVNVGGSDGGPEVAPHTTLVPVAIQGVPAGQHQLVLIPQTVYPGLQHQFNWQY
jgi:hypothetical protein